MLHVLDDVLEQHLRKTVPLGREIAVSFAMPDREWSTGITRPTVNAFMWDIRREDKRVGSGVELVGDGSSKTRRLSLPRVRVSYFISTWTGDQRDEHVLLGRLLQGLLRVRRLDMDEMPPEFASLGSPIELLIGAGDTRTSKDFWGAVDGKFRPGLDLQVILPVDPGFGTLAGPPTEGLGLKTTDSRQPSRQSERVRSYVEEVPSQGDDG
ncbi:MAG: Pvc16 family protein [Actinomycetota bacterium]|nr:Pvc16 family protein [Actinomycetota bacterium]MDA2971834.1 Pvc16 family protein [Actinomycetota bacterium]MDA3001251.1 Pvc16 family protein [Actinomycetota bacterium]